jgi:hypothetical protein
VLSSKEIEHLWDRYGHGIRESWRLGLAGCRKRNGNILFSPTSKRGRASREEEEEDEEKRR